MAETRTTHSLSSSSSSLLSWVRAQIGRQPVMLALLTLLAVVLFLAVSGLSRVYHAQREALGNRWFARGVSDLSAGHYDQAVIEFRAALLYSPDDYTYQLNLAEALLGLKRTSEAYSYLINLWDRQPSDGLVNLELARIAAERGETEQAERYYHDAIYSAWPSDQEGKRREARLELIDFLLRNNDRAQAESEVIALEANVGDDAALQARVGNLFVRTLDYERALAAYHASLKSDRHNHAALAGAGLAAFELERYPLAYRYLQGAVAADPSDAESAARLKTTELVLQMDPFQRQISVVQRNRLVVEAFEAAGKRLKDCALQAPAPAAAAGLQSNLAETWEKMKPHITEPGLQRKPDLAEAAMDLVFNIERQNEHQTGGSCGAPTETDQALLLIANMHEGN